MSIDELVVREVIVDRAKEVEQVIDSLVHTRWVVEREVVFTIPLGGRDKDTVQFFELHYTPSPEQLEHEYGIRGLRPDPVALFKVMTDDPTLADKQPVIVQWRDDKRQVCFAYFYSYDLSHRRVIIRTYRDEHDYSSTWFDGHEMHQGHYVLFAGVPK
jgi:hypothetical protein